MKNKIIYFDNAATSYYKPKIIYKSFIKSLKFSANPGRSGHKLSLKNSLKIWQTRELIAKHFGEIESENVIFTKNCTEALNIAILGTAKTGGHVIASCFEHNSVLRPLHHLEQSGKISLTIIKPNNKKFITTEDILPHLTPKTYLICVCSQSNATGTKNNYFEIGTLCKQKNILFLVDNAQGAGHIKINMKKNNINFLTFSGHKGFFTPQGIGALCINSHIIPMPIMYGGTGSNSQQLLQPQNLPDLLESGTIQSQLIASLYEGIKYIEKNFIKINKKTANLCKYLFLKLKEIDGITIYNFTNFNSGIIAFNYKNQDSTTISDYLDKQYNIAVRGGLHCAPLTHKFLNTEKQGVVRISLSFKNTKKEIRTLIKAIKNFETIKKLT